MKYRVDNVPRLRRPFWLAWSWALGLGGWLMYLLLHVTCRFRFEGQAHRDSRDNFVFSVWHRYWFLWFVTFIRSHRRHVWMQHPAAYMKPVHIGLRLMGIRVVLGSGGEEGRRAADRLAEGLREGWSTAISPDGPQGPPQVLKKGVLHVALKSGLPILPVRFEASRAFVLRTWDRKVFPLPFSCVSVTYGEPVVVTEENFEEAARLVARRMTAPEA